MKKGFTLVELLASLVLIGMLSTILITVSVKKINESKEHSRNIMINSIELAAKEYVLNNSSKIEEFKTKDCVELTLKTLIENEMFTNALVDQTKKESLPLSDTVYVTRSSNGKLNATYDINQKEHTKIILNGSFNEYVKKGSTFNDPGVTAISTNGSNVNPTISGTVNTNQVGNYTITYSHGGTTITRNVIVIN